MNSYTDRPHSARRAYKEAPTDTKRQRSEKDAKPKSANVEQPDNSFNIVVQIRTALYKIEAKLDKGTRALEQSDDGKSEVRGMESKTITPEMGALFEDLKRIEKKLTQHSELDETLVKRLKQQAMDDKKTERMMKELRMERDVLQERMHTYLEQISSLKSKIEEQRCSIGAYERQVNAEYEIHLRKLESKNEDLRNSAMQKDKQLKEANEQLRQVYKMLKSYETLSWRKKNEESVFISILKNDLQTLWNEKIKMEEEFKRMKRMCGYIEQDVQSRVSSEDYTGMLLRRSKSMSDLTLQTKDSDLIRKDTPSTQPSTPCRYSSKNSHGEGSTIDSPAESVTVSRQKIFQELTEIEKKLSEQAEEVKKLRLRKAKMDESSRDKSTSIESIGSSMFNASQENVAQKVDTLKEHFKLCGD